MIHPSGRFGRDFSLEFANWVYLSAVFTKCYTVHIHKLVQNVLPFSFFKAELCITLKNEDIATQQMNQIGFKDAF